MKKILFIFLFTNLIYGQEIAKKPFKIKPEIGLSITTQVFQGNNYLSKGHKNPSFGGELKLNLVHYNNFKLGGTLEKSTLKVSDFSIGGNSDKTNINSASVILSYQFQMTNKLNLIPQVSYGGVELRQKNGSKLFGVQNGSKIGLSVNGKYKLSTHFSILTNVGYNKYLLNVNTTSEFQEYFNNTSSINYSLGLSFN